MDLQWLGAPPHAAHSSMACSVANNGAVAGVAFAEDRRPREDGSIERAYIAHAFRWHNGALEELGALGEGGEPRCFITPEGDRIVASNRETLLLWRAEGETKCAALQGTVRGISACASVLVGEQNGRAVRWVNGVAEWLCNENASAAHAVSANGQIIAGHVNYKACLWSSDGAARILGTLYGGRCN